MSNSNYIIETGIKKVFQKILQHELQENVTMDDIPQWDSLRHIQLIAALEKEFEIEIGFEDSLLMTNTDSIKKVLNKYIDVTEKNQEIENNDANETKINQTLNKSNQNYFENKNDANSNVDSDLEDNNNNNNIGESYQNTLLLPHQKIGYNIKNIEYQNIYQLFLDKAERSPEKEFIIFPDQQKNWTYQTFHNRFLNVEKFFKQKNIAEGERICLIMPNCPEFLEVYFAGLKLGTIIVPINPDLSPQEMLHIINDSGAGAIFYISSLKEKVNILQATLSCPFYSQDEILLDPIQDDVQDNIHKSSNVQLTDKAVIIYTSGTTGKPKGAVLSHLNLLADAKAVSEWFSYDSNTRTLCVLPLFHNNGQVMTLLTPLYSGGSSVIVRGKSSLISFWWLVDKYNVNWSSVMPSILSILLSLPGERKDTSMQGIQCGGQVLTKNVQEAFEKRFKVPVFEGYGLTETTSFSCFNNHPADLRKEGVVGRALPVNEISIMDNYGKKLPSGINGEICIRGLNVINEYHGLLEKNKTSFKEGWFHTGDFGFLDESGYLHFRTRRDFLIIKGGENIYPAEIENVLFKHPAVAEAAAIGIPHKLLGEDICAFVKLRNGMITNKEELQTHLTNKLAPFKHPANILIVDNLPLKDIPKGPTQKVLYRSLKEYYLKYIHNQQEKK